MSLMMDERRDVMGRLEMLDEPFEVCVGSGSLGNYSEQDQEASPLWLCET
jgi:hypothetical protein